MDTFVLENHPKLESPSLAQHEIHIFLNPINPSDNDIVKYYCCVNKWNQENSQKYSEKYGNFIMKPCLLELIFREKYSFKEIPVKVMQSAVYIKCNDMSAVIDESHKQVQYFKDNGFSILREKIEAIAYGMQGIPREDAQVVVYKKNDYIDSPYFEAHIKCELANQSLEKDIALLQECCNFVTLKYKTPCPFSYNCNPNKLPNDNQGSQMFINTRFRKLGLNNVTNELSTIKNFIKSKNIKIIKAIVEYVWYDTNVAVDRYWIDFDPSEKQAFLEKLINN